MCVIFYQMIIPGILKGKGMKQKSKKRKKMVFCVPNTQVMAGAGRASATMQSI
jgi:hypothetical protein